MRTFVHLVLFVCAIVMAVGAFGPLLGTIEPHNVALVDLRDGFAAGRSLTQIGGHTTAFWTSMTVVLLGAAAAVLLAALVGSRLLGWLGVVVAVGTLGVLAWRLDERFDQQLRHDYSHLLNGKWGLYLIGGGLVVTLLSLLVPRERRAKL